MDDQISRLTVGAEESAHTEALPGWPPHGRDLPVVSYTSPSDPAQRALEDAERNWSLGLAAARQQQTERARSWFHSALERDPEQFDAWLALHMLDPTQDGLLDRLVATQRTAHALRSRANTRYSSSYWLTECLQLQLTNGADASYAQAARMLRDGNVQQAVAALAQLPPDCRTSAQTLVLQGRIAIAREHYFAAVESFQRLPTEGLLAAERARLLGTALRLQGQLIAAAHTLVQALNATGAATSPEAKRDVLYQLALCNQELGNEPAYRHFLEVVYAEDASYRDVRARLFPEQETEWRFQQIVAELGDVGGPDFPTSAT